MSSNTIKLTLSDLDSMSSMTQGVDLQYVPLSGLQVMQRKKLTREEFREKISSSIQAEFRRSLLYSKNVVINRAFILATKELYNPILNVDDDRDAYLALFRNQSIIPYLYTEKSVMDEGEIIKQDNGVKAMKELIKENEQVACVRLSWKENDNLRSAQEMASAFTSYMLSARTVADKIAFDLGIRDLQGFKRKLSEVSSYTNKMMDKKGRDYITRIELYKKFICPATSNEKTSRKFINEGFYDFNKPFWKELKLVFDLKYQSNLTDKLRIQTFSASDLPERTSLRELDMRVRSMQDVEMLDLPLVFSDIVFSMLRQGLWLNRINDLTFKDIVKLRMTDEYNEFILSAAKLKSDAQDIIIKAKQSKQGGSRPLNFRDFYGSFYNYQKAIAKIPEKKRLQNIKPKIELILKIGTAVIALSPIDSVAKIVGSVGTLSAEGATFTAKIIASAAKDVDLALDFDFMQTKIQDAEREYRRLIENLKKNKYQIVRSKSKSRNAVLSREYPELY